MDSSEIHSEPWLVLRLIGAILLTPITLILIPFGKRTIGDLLAPFTLITRWLFEAPLTAGVSVVLAIVFALQFIFDLSAFIVTPASMITAPWTIVSSALLHGNLSHLLWNLFALIAFGRIVEMSYGRARWLLIFIGSAAAGSLLFGIIGLATGDPTGAVGASGGISGLIAAAMLSNPLRISFASIIPLPVAASASFYLLTNAMKLIGGVDDGVSYAGHIGGLIGGAALASIGSHGEHKLGWILVGICSVIILALGLV